MKFLRADNQITFCGERPVDMNDRESEGTAVELTLPTGLSKKAWKCWDYFDGTAFAFEYKDRLVVTDEGMYLTEHGDGTREAPFGFPRWVVDSWEELEQILEEIYDDLEADDLLPETEDSLTPEERHIASLNNNGARIKAPDGSTEPVSMDFYRRAVEQCREGGFNAITYELELPGIDGEFMIAFWSTGHVDSGSTQRIIECLASR